jgi:hypothetical protein
MKRAKLRKLSPRQIRIRKQIARHRHRASVAIAERLKRRGKPQVEPRYDEIYWEGMKWLNSL